MSIIKEIVLIEKHIICSAATASTSNMKANTREETFTTR